MATSPLRKAVALTSAEASSSSAEAASERLRNLLEVFRLLTRLRKKAQEHHTEMKAYAAYGHFPLLRDPNRPDILIDIDESESFLPFVFNATIVFAVTVLDDLLESLQRVLMSSGNQELVVEANVIIGDRSPKSDWGKSDAIQKPRELQNAIRLCLVVPWSH